MAVGLGKNEIIYVWIVLPGTLCPSIFMRGVESWYLFYMMCFFRIRTSEYNDRYFEDTRMIIQICSWPYSIC